MKKSIGTAYVQILPTTDGITGQLTSALQGPMREVGASAGSDMGLALSGGMTGVAVAGATMAAKAIGDLVSESVQGYADYEQLVGGVETLFKDSADTVQAYAANAYKTAGLSANDYMETVTSFSASLLQSLGGDTAAAADMADLAITDMSDNANKMGSDMTSIQNAYQSFARGQFQLLDNLKLGYGGSQAEMQRLLADATALSGVEYDISSYADIVEAIHVIQTEMGIAGTTAAEASTTIQGSAASMRAAWDNLVTGLADENADIEALVDNFVNSAITAGENLIPRISVVLQGVGTLISEGAEQLIPVVVDVLIENLPQLTESGVRLVTAIVAGLLQAAPQLLAATPEILAAIFRGLQAGWPAVREAGVSILVMIGNGIRSAVNQAWSWGSDLIQNFINGIVARWQSLVNTITSVARTVWSYLHFSEPETGPLADFHTYAPDMMELYARGIREGEPGLRQQLQRSFDFTDLLTPTAPRPAAQTAAQAARADSSGQGGRNLTVVLMLDRAELGRAVYTLNNEETQRVGMRLAGGFA